MAFAPFAFDALGEGDGCPRTPRRPGSVRSRVNVLGCALQRHGKFDDGHRVTTGTTLATLSSGAIEGLRLSACSRRGPRRVMAAGVLR